jgi:hypothetical protein
MKETDRADIIITLIKHDKIIREAEKLAEQVGQVHGYFDDRWRLDEVEVDTANIRAVFWAQIRGESDYESITFPLSYLWDEDWEKKEREAIRKQKEENKRKYLEKQEKMRAEKEEREKAEFARLKAKYEPLDEAKYVVEQARKKTGSTIIDHRKEDEQ